jgi:glucosamine--fructose-6-phosphate aminotransferase (isomerizing)
MCGITGYIGGSDSTAVLKSSLKNLEYRGYDSAGIALVDDTVEVYKQQGTIDDVAVPTDCDPSHGIGHTRWSTHGEPSDDNAHPHTDCTGELAVVHNGIIGNFHELKAELGGHVFTSDTDTEVIPHLIEEELERGRDLYPAVSDVINRLEGSFAIAVTHADCDAVVLARQDSPLVIGHGDDGMFIGSDVTAFVEYTRQVTYLEDGDVAALTPDGVTITNDGTVVDRPITQVTWDAAAAGKSGHDHYMHKEIHEQPHALLQSLSGRLDELAGEVDLDIHIDQEVLADIDRIQLVACGTSYHAGLFAKRLFETLANVSVTVTRASEYHVTGANDPASTLALAITQSGETADTLSAIREAVSMGARTMAVTNTVGSTVTREVDDTIFIQAGPEIGVAATKTFVSQVATLALFSVYLGRTRNAISRNDAATFLSNLRELPGAVQEILDAEGEIERLAAAYGDGESFFFIGRHLGYPVALESALKLKEISYDHAEGFAAGELKHGPLALVTPETPVIALLTEGTEPQKTLNNVKEVESRGASVIGMASIEESTAFCDETVDIPDIGRMESLVANVALQLFAYHIAKNKDRNIDKPRNLAKSVTVE